ncbi:MULTISPECIES: ABC transporter permease [unclassified Lactococcus]|uniref:ABC transporter permease n=1 Tax=unclassified Lactococcus TaxID=2643510 RepID=UPI0011CBFD82|nr:MULTISPECIES: ABC transporter permease [unclassified Lactococcus]MQW22782.1 ABC transporter permease [Lactococcus sp. dk101]TXK44786.1 ABC transporter permease [Lactococcus sp. dk310]TXK50680.1 ABC transporter permease [Lactococcus sp. dk322]
MKIFKFELKRFILNKRNRYLLTLISVLVVFYAAYSTISLLNLFSRSYLTELSQTAQSNEKSLTDSIKSFQDSIQSSKNQSEISNNNTSIYYMNKLKILYHSQVQVLETKNINRYYDLQKQIDIITLKENQNSMPQSGLIQQNFELKQDIKYIQLVQKRHLDFEIMPSVQAHAFGNFQQQFVPILSSALFIVLFASMVSITVASGYEANENRWYRFADIDLKKNLIVKVFAGTVATYVWLVVASIAYFIVIATVNGVGSWNYPAYLGDVNVTTGFMLTNISISNGILDIGCVFYLFFVLLFLASLGALISVFVKRSMVVFGVISLLVLGYSMIENISWLVPFQPYIPMSYFSPLKLFGNPTSFAGKYSVLVGVVYLTLLSVIFMLIAGFVIKNQRMRKL